MDFLSQSTSNSRLTKASKLAYKIRNTEFSELYEVSFGGIIMSFGAKMF